MQAAGRIPGTPRAQACAEQPRRQRTQRRQRQQQQRAPQPRAPALCRPSCSAAPAHPAGARCRLADRRELLHVLQHSIERWMWQSVLECGAVSLSQQIVLITIW